MAPDDFEGTIAASYDAAAWATAEAAGLVCLPAASRRSGSNVDNVGVGLFWSSTARAGSTANILTFTSDKVLLDGYESREYGCSVRLVTEVPTEN